MAESTDQKFLDDCRRLLDIFKGRADWNHQRPALKLAALEAHLDACVPIAADVPTKLAPFKIVINGRQTEYAKIKPFVRRSRRYLKSSGATALELKDADGFINSILGQRSAPRRKDDPNTPAAEAQNSHSVSQLSYAAQYGNLFAYRQFLGNVSAYDPTETDLKLTGMDAFLQTLDNANAAVSAGFVPISQAWSLRDAKLYNDPDSLLEHFRDAKEYYKSLVAPNTPEYRMVTAITLRPNRRR